MNSFLVTLIFIQFVLIYAAPVRHQTRSERRASRALRDPDLFDGDIILNKNILIKNDTFFNAVANDNQLWQNGVIPYEISNDLRSIHYQIEDAFRHIQDRTCLRFKLRTHEHDYVHISAGQGKSCSSSVGLAGGRQEMTLGAGCEYIGTILHELMHVIGFYHEHARSDRDEYLRIHYENIDPGRESNFAKLTKYENRLLEPFDYQSVTIYGEFSFSRNDLPTMEALNGELITDPHYKNGLTQHDIRAIQKLYYC